MSVQNAQVLVPPLRPVPSSASLLGDLAAWMFTVSEEAGTRLVARLDVIQARRHVERAARGEARARAELVALARRYESTQPEFAKDLYAAARSSRSDADA